MGSIHEYVHESIHCKVTNTIDQGTRSVEELSKAFHVKGIAKKWRAADRIGLAVDDITFRNRLSATCLDLPVCTRKASTTAADVLDSRPWTRSSERIDFVLVYRDNTHAGPPTPPDTLRDFIASQHELRAATHTRCRAAATGRKHSQH